MYKKTFFAGLVLCLFLVTSVKAINIVFVGENEGIDGEWVSFLEANGHTVDYRSANWTTLDEGKIAELEAADLIIVNATGNSGNYDDGDEVAQWSGLTTGMINMYTYLTRNSRWQFMNSSTVSTVDGAMIQAEDPRHLIFTGVKLDANGQVDILDETIEDQLQVIGTTDVGSGFLLASVVGADGTFIAEWQPGVPYYDGSAVPGGIRMCFHINRLAGMCLNEQGQLLFLNMITYASGGSFAAAAAPIPEDEAIEVSIDADLSWDPGTYANTHDVYLSTVFDDANEATVDVPLDALLQAGHDVNNFVLDRLEYAQTYYWRVDEVNSAPDYTVYKGNTWSFTTELFSYPIMLDKITISASSSAANQGAENTINGSGIDPNINQHTNYGGDMWISETGDAAPWIQYEFDTVYKMDRMLVWNYNAEFPGNLFGAGDVTIEYSADGENWETSDVTEFTQAPGTNDYEAGDTVEFGYVAVKYVKISINKNQADESLAAFFNSAGLSEVLFLAIPAKARFPIPEVGTVDVNIFSPTLSWTVGRGAVEHNVYLDGDLMEAGLTETTYTVPMTLDLSTTYEWRVDEVNNAEADSVWPGSSWSFTTMDYLVVEDFEDYNDTVGFRVYDNAWLDGYDVPSNGALLGHGELPIMETGEVYAGDQSAPVYFDNTSATFSEVFIDPANLAIGRDFSVGSPQALVLWVYGQDPNAATEQLYVKVNNTKIVSDVDLTAEDWTAAIFDISGMNLSSVSNLAVGLERTGAAGGVGLVYIDEIRLYGSAEAVVEE